MNSVLKFLFDLFNLDYRQQVAFFEIIKAHRGIFSNFSLKKLIASLLIIGEMWGCIFFGNGVTPRGQELDISDYELVFCDEFEGDSLNLDVWRHRGVGARRSGFNAESQVSVANGEMTITGEYLENGAYGAGWYTGAVAVKQYYKQGYYEIKCKCNAGKEFWSAFWLQASNPYDHYASAGGVNGAEIDIFEAMSYGERLPKNRNSIRSTVHCNGVDDDIEHIDSQCVGEFKVGNDIFNEYNTYGLEWTEEEYIFYVNGVESGRTSFGKGVSQVPEEVIVSLEISGNEVPYPNDWTTQMVVDYVKIYQKNPSQNIS